MTLLITTSALPPIDASWHTFVVIQRTIRSIKNPKYRIDGDSCFPSCNMSGLLLEPNPLHLFDFSILPMLFPFSVVLPYRAGALLSIVSVL
jgi:hypothetical protein